MRIDKRATTVGTEEVVKLIIYVAGIAVLIILFVSLYSMATYDKEKETAKSYLSSFKKAIAEIDKEGDEAEFSLWSGKPKMIYFGDSSYAGSDREFFRTSSGDNVFCFCYEKSDEWKCKDCVSLDYPAVFESSVGSVFEVGTEFNIKLENKRFIFSLK
tara:strand:+ start:25 stop:498 length:474 start_codon:yes stop_codon:yes gene_type:complete